MSQLRLKIVVFAILILFNPIYLNNNEIINDLAEIETEPIPDGILSSEPETKPTNMEQTIDSVNATHDSQKRKSSKLKTDAFGEPNIWYTGQKIRVVYNETESTKEFVPSERRYIDHLHIQHRFYVTLTSNYNITVYTDWNLTSITPSATFSYNSTGEYWQFNNTNLVTYTFLFTEPLDVLYTGSKHVTDSRMHDTGFESDYLTDWHPRSDSPYGFNSTAINYTNSFDGAGSLRINDNDSTFEELFLRNEGLAIEAGGFNNFQFVFSYYIDIGEANSTSFAIELRTGQGNNGVLLTQITGSDLVFGRWATAYARGVIFFVNTLDGEDYQIKLRFVDTDNPYTVFIDNFQIHEERINIDIIDSQSSIITGLIYNLDGRNNIIVPNEEIWLNLYRFGPVNYINRTIMTDENGFFSYVWFGHYDKTTNIVGDPNHNGYELDVWSAKNINNWKTNFENTFVNLLAYGAEAGKVFNTNIRYNYTVTFSDTTATLSSENNTLWYEIFINSSSIGEYWDLEPIPLDTRTGFHNFTVIPIDDSSFPDGVPVRHGYYPFHPSQAWSYMAENLNYTISAEGSMFVRFQDGIGRSVPFETFTTYYRFNDTGNYNALGNSLLPFNDTSLTVNLYVNDSFGQEITNETTSFELFHIITILTYELLFTNHVNQTLLAQIKIPSLGWSEAVGYWISEANFRTVSLFNGTYDIRILENDGTTVLQTLQRDINQDSIVELKEDEDLVIFSYTWEVDVIIGNVTLAVNTNYRDTRIRIFDNGGFIGTFNENATITWDIATGVNASQVVFYVERNVTKYGGLEEQSFVRAFAYPISSADDTTLLSDLGYIEFNDYFNITVTTNQPSALVYIWHDGIVNQSASIERNFIIDKDVVTAGNHNITILIAWNNGTSDFIHVFVIDYWTASFYTVSLDALPNSEGLKLVQNQINFLSFNTYVNGELANPVIPDELDERTTENINVTLISDGRLWIRNTAFNMSLKIYDKFDVPIFSTFLDLRTFTYRVIELPLVYMQVRSTRDTNAEVQMFIYNATTNDYQLGPLIGVPANSEINPVWVVAGQYTVRVWDVVTNEEVINNQRTSVPLYSEDRTIGNGFPINIGNPDGDLVETPWTQLELTPDYFSYGQAPTLEELAEAKVEEGFFDQIINGFKAVFDWLNSNLAIAIVVLILIIIIVGNIILEIRRGRAEKEEAQIDKQAQVTADKIKDQRGLEKITDRTEISKDALPSIKQRDIKQPKRETKKGDGLGLITARTRHNKNIRSTELTNVMQRKKVEIRRKKQSKRRSNSR